MIFAIVTPCYNPGNYILKTIKSVISQSGDFIVYYHIQDANSKDGTLQVLESFVEQIIKGNVPIQCRLFSFSYSSEPDQGMYDAINKGFKRILSKVKPDIMIWINSDDCLADKALANLKRYFEEYPEAEWVTGRIIHINEEDKIIVDHPAGKYSIEDLASGRHDGVSLPFVCQEATAWRYSAFLKVGWLNNKLRYVGDYEYWIRMAKKGIKLHTVDFPIGYHRKRRGQLSSSICYDMEMKILLSKWRNGLCY